MTSRGTHAPIMGNWGGDEYMWDGGQKLKLTAFSLFLVCHANPMSNGA